MGIKHKPLAKLQRFYDCYGKAGQKNPLDFSPSLKRPRIEPGSSQLSMALGTEPGIKCKKHVVISGMTDDMILKMLFVCNPSRRGDAAMAMTNHSILGQ